MVEIIQIMTRALRNEEYGANAQLPTIPGAERLTEFVKIIDVTEEPGANPLVNRVLDWPVLIVSLQSPIDARVEMNGDILRDMDSVPVFIDIVVGGTDPAPSVRDVLYYIRAILKCIRTLMKQEHDEDTLMNDIEYQHTNSITWGPTNQEIGPGRIVGTVVPNFKVRDHAP